jgi:hypothetical protein
MLGEAALLSTAGIGLVNLVFLFIASHAIRQGAVIWVLLAEIFSNNVRTKGQSLGSGTHWVFAALIALLMPYLLGRFSGAAIFGFFTAMMVLQLAWVLWVMPETKGRSLESLAEHLSRHEHANFDPGKAGRPDRCRPAAANACHSRRCGRPGTALVAVTPQKRATR